MGCHFQDSSRWSSKPRNRTHISFVSCSAGDLYLLSHRGRKWLVVLNSLWKSKESVVCFTYNTYLECKNTLIPRRLATTAFFEPFWGGRLVFKGPVIHSRCWPVQILDCQPDLSDTVPSLTLAQFCQHMCAPRGGKPHVPRIVYTCAQLCRCVSRGRAHQACYLHGTWVYRHKVRLCDSQEHMLFPTRLAHGALSTETILLQLHDPWKRTPQTPTHQFTLMKKL